ncbi:XdhC family protein [Fulvimarina sp. MAC8]|uniref:XdhC family protein n=1 Tax=Fulvimarina sp. MAC8 TaxID=3162874 RepID=UPI0032EC9DCA
MRHDILQAVNAERAARRAVVTITDIDTGNQRVLREAEIGADPMADVVEKAVRTGKSGMVETEGGQSFINVYLPPVRIVLIGAVHISQALAPIARIAGYDVEIIDPRTAFATPDRFAGFQLDAEWPDVVLKQRPLDPYTAVALITHDPKIDDGPLIEALKTGCFYIGALGSRKTHARRLERLSEAGIADHLMERIDAPIGADIGAATPGEIAVAIMASIVEAFRKRKMFAEQRGEQAPQ